MPRNRGFSPPRNSEFRRVWDRWGGSAACWMRQELDGTVTMIAYLSSYETDADGIWVFNTEPGHYLLHDVYDKPHRVRHWTNPSADSRKVWGYWNLIEHRPIPAGQPKRRGKKWRGGGPGGHKSYLAGGDPYKPWVRPRWERPWLPRKFR